MVVNVEQQRREFKIKRYNARRWRNETPYFAGYGSILSLIGDSIVNKGNTHTAFQIEDHMIGIVGVGVSLGINLAIAGIAQLRINSLNKKIAALPAEKSPGPVIY